MKTIVVANQKGGVGKTTVARHMAFYAMENGLRTLVVDLDPQQNFSKTFLHLCEHNYGEEAAAAQALVAADLFEKKPPKREPLRCADTLDLVQATPELLDVPSMPIEAMTLPRAALARLGDNYDVCIIDTPPTLGHELYAALIAADGVVCTCTLDQDAIDGLGALFGSISTVKEQRWNTGVSLLGVLPTLVMRRSVTEQKWLDQLREELGARRTGWERQALALVLQIAVLLQRSAEEAAAAQPDAKPDRINELIRQCADYVCGNLDADLSLRAVSRRFAVSGEYLTRCFTKEMGISFYQYVLLQRVAEGKRLLAGAPDLSIADIACSIGFPSPSHFSRHFRKLTEQTPSEYRRKLRGGGAAGE